MPDPRMVKLAELLVNYSVEVQSGDWVIVVPLRSNYVVLGLV